MSKPVELIVDNDACLELYNIGQGIFSPLKGYMDSADYRSVIENMRLDNGYPWTIPVTLDICEQKAEELIKADTAILKNINGEAVGELNVEDIYKVDFTNDIKKIFGTEDLSHPGVAKEIGRSPFRVGGPIKVLRHKDKLFPEYSLSPIETREKFKEYGWKTVIGFQTRNPIHRAHEYLQRIGMEITDGIFIQPLIGWKKPDDFSPDAVVRSYEKMLKMFYPSTKAMLGLLKTPMRYAGPREAIFHAIIRKNYGCTHFIIGRDHAGVSNYYGKYDAHKLSCRFKDLGIEILRLHGPYYCRKCFNIVTEKTCPHGEKYAESVSGTQLRSMFVSGKRPPETYMRKEISDVLIELGRKGRLFCGD